MSEQLIILLNDQPASHPSWGLVIDGHVNQSVMHGDPVLLADLAKNRDVIVVVPGLDILLTAAALPKMSRSKFLQALPYALEEQCIDEVDELHFVPANTYVDNQLPVAVVAKAKMTAWLDQLKEWQVEPSAVIPLTLLLPCHEGNWSVFVDRIATVRMSAYHGFACDLVNLNAMLSAAMLETGSVPSSILLLSFSAAAVDLQVTAKVETTSLTEQDFFAMIARQLNSDDHINLLQGEFAIKRSRFPRQDRITNWTVQLALIFAAVLFLYPVVSLIILSQRSNDLNDNIAAIYKQHFPNAKSMVAPKIRMSDKLQKLEAQAGENRLLVLMGYIGKSMQNVSNIKLKALSFQNNELTLEVSAATAQDFSAFTDALTQQGLNVKQQNANVSGARVTATLQVE